ncbi:Os03g0832850, partial [Oryza sativa Japonica Group]
MEHGHLRVQRHGLHVGAELREERAEAQQERLAAGGPLRAHHQAAAAAAAPGAGEVGLHGGAVGGAVAGEAEGADRGEDLGEAADAVGGGGEVGAAGDGGDIERVEEGAVVADEEVQDRGGPQRGGGDAAAVDAEGGGDRGGEGEGEDDDDEGDAEEGEGHGQRQPHEHGQRRRRRRPERDAAVVEDEGLRVSPGMEGTPSPPRPLRRHVHLLHSLMDDGDLSITVTVAGAAALLHPDHLLHVQPLHDLAVGLREAKVIPPERPQLRRHDGVDGEVLLQERLHHLPRHGAHAHQPPPPRRRIEHLGADVLQEQLGHHRPAHPEGRRPVLLLPDSGEADHDHELGGPVMAEQEQHGVEQQQEEAAEEPPGLQRDEHEVREGRRRHQQAALHLAHRHVRRRR